MKVAGHTPPYAVTPLLLLRRYYADIAIIAAAVAAGDYCDITLRARLLPYAATITPATSLIRRPPR